MHGEPLTAPRTDPAVSAPESTAVPTRGERELRVCAVDPPEHHRLRKPIHQDIGSRARFTGFPMFGLRPNFNEPA